MFGPACLFLACCELILACSSLLLPYYWWFGCIGGNIENLACLRNCEQWFLTGLDVQLY